MDHRAEGEQQFTGVHMVRRPSRQMPITSDDHGQRIKSEMLDERVESLEERMGAQEDHTARVQTSLSLGKWIAGFVIAAVLGSVIVVFTKVFSWGFGDGELRQRVFYLEHEMDSLKSVVHDISRTMDHPVPGASPGK